jgi:carboxymethylenebutenolidase
MKIRTVIKVSVVTMAIAALSVVAGGRFVLEQHSVQAAGRSGATARASVAAAPAPMAMPLGLPAEDTAKMVLNASLPYHHPQWVDVPMGSARIRTFVIYPDLAGKLPVVLVTANNEGLSDWVRAVGTEVVNEGFIAVVPDILSGAGPNGGGTDSFADREAIAAALGRLGQEEIERRTKAVRDYFASQPGSNGKSAILDFNWSEARLDAAINTPEQQRVAKFDLTEHAWHNTLALLTSLADPAQVVAPPQDAAAAQREGLKELAQRNDIPPGYQTAMKVANESPRHGEWIDIPVATVKGTVKVHSWLVQPLGNDKAPVIVAIHAGPGMDLLEPPRKGEGANWMRALGDKLAAAGYIVIMPDLASGLGPNGGNFDSFKYPDDVGKAVQTRPAAERMDFIRAARDYALKLPRATGKSGTIGFCNGGGMAWESAAAIPGLNAAVSFYGAPPDPATMAKIQAPVIAFAGDQDPGLAPRVAAAAPDMQKLGKVFEFRIYPGTTHAFLSRQDLGLNSQATLDSWPRAMAFFAKYLKGTTTSSVN